MFAKIPIGAIHAVMDDGGEYYYILDGKQRFNAITSFLNNNFYVMIDGNEYTWNDIYNNKSLFKLREKFLDSSFQMF